MKRVCIIRHKYYPQAVPTRRNAETLVSHGYDVDIVCLRNKGEKSREVVRGVNVYRLPVEHHRNGMFRYVFEYCAFFMLAFLTMTWLSLTKRYKAVQIDNMPDFLVFAALVPKLLGARIILQILDHTPEVFMDGFKLGPEHRVMKILRLLEKASIVWSDHIVVTQSASKKIFEDRGVPESKISVVLNVPVEEIFQSTPHSSNGSERFIVLTHGRIVVRYSQQTLISAVPFLKEEIPNLEVRIIGDGEGLPQLQELAKSLGVDDIVSFPGWLPMDEIPAHIAQADVCVVVIPAGKNPAMPNKLFEYSALGRASVVTENKTIEAYYGKNTVMYYEPGCETDLARCIIELYRNPEKRNSIATASAAVYQQNRWGKTQYEYLKTIENQPELQVEPTKEESYAENKCQPVR